jgi:membrane protein implicated in regulation of membrane protease activity
VLLLLGLAGLFLLPEPWNVVAVCVAALVETAEVWFWIKFLRRYRVRTGAEGMIGERGEVIEAFEEGSGRVRVYGEIWSARSPGRELAIGERVRVAAVSGLTLEVRPEADESAPWGTEKGP